MPEEVYDTGPATNAEFATTTLRFAYTSLVTPGTVFDEDLDTGERTLLKTTEVLGGHDPGRLRHRAALGDGARRRPGADLRTCTAPTSLGTAPRRACSTATAPTRRASTPASPPAPLPARPRLRVRHRPRARRRRDGTALVRRRQAPPQAQHLHRLHRLRRAPRRRGVHAPPTGWWRAARRPAGC